MQSEADVERIRSLGAAADRVHVTGNVKYDLPDPPPFGDAARVETLAAGRPVLLAASTADPEEEVVLGAWSSLDPRPLLVLAPRRPERFEPVASLVRRKGFPLVRRSEPAAAAAPDAGAVYLLDSIGELASAYREARVAFVGGSIAPLGGHNPIEAWACGVPTILGPHVQNFRQIAEDGESGGFSKRIAGARELASEVAAALGAPDRLHEAGRRARAFVAENRGAADRTADLVLPLLAVERRRLAGS
jgi:3-deoxy-D-manno-octulosonic-acid transferase